MNKYSKHSAFIVIFKQDLTCSIKRAVSTETACSEILRCIGFEIKGCHSLLCWFLFRFEHVPLVTPNGDILVNDLSFEVNTAVQVIGGF